MDTLTKSCSPTTVITANGEVQTHEEATVYVKELDTFLTTNVLMDTPAVLSLGKLCDEHGHSYEWINGQKPHPIKNCIRIQCNTENFVPIVVPGVSTSSSLFNIPWHFQGRKLIILRLPQARLPHQPWHLQLCQTTTQAREDLCGIDSYPVTVSSKHVERQARGDLCSSGTPEEQLLTEPTKNPKTKQNEDPDLERRDLLHSDIPEWLQEFREILVDERVPELRDSHAISSHEVSLEPTFKRREVLGKHTVYAHFPEDRNCEICQRTKMTRTPCRRRSGGAVPRAEKFGDLTTADHKVLS